MFTSKELFFFQSFVKIFECFEKKGKVNTKKVSDYFEKLKKEKESLENKNENEKLKIEHLQNEYQFLITEFQILKGFPKVYISILKAKYSLFNNNYYRKEILQIVLYQKELLLESKTLLILYFKKYHISQASIIKENTKDDFLLFRNKNNNSPLQILNDANSNNNHFLKEFLLFFFQQAINIMFTNENKTEKNKQFNITDILLNCFKFSIKYIVHFEAQKDDNFKHLSLLYAIGFVKVYLSYYVQKSQEQTNLSEVNQIIENKGRNNTIKIIQIYILKLFNHILGWNQLCSINWVEKYQITWTKEFAFGSTNKKVVDYLFLNVNNTDVQHNIKSDQQLSELINNNKLLSFFDDSILQAIEFHNKNNNKFQSLIIPISVKQSKIFCIYCMILKNIINLQKRLMKKILRCG